MAQPGCSTAVVPRARRRSGVTLIELLIVLTIVSILIGIVFWKIDVARYQINGDQQVVGTALIAAQRQAIAKQHNMVVVFDDANHEMRIISDANNNGQADAGENVRSISLGDRVRYGLGTAPPMSWGSSAISFTVLEGATGLPCVIFYRNGSASESRGVYLSSTRAQSDPAFVRDVRAIHVERATGRAEWWHYDGTNWVRGF
ncbi:MAG TPA: prepilin-type N-terminal cleavage/methylation domain-containing protein [Gemmatimonadaceae bacterium]|nr:prepilin-type N-terminal cleavage/methylation domain-containing protein [Gemmatimonadaceae bacterium]